MAPFDYFAEAELFFVRRKNSRRKPAEYKRFAQASLAIRFVIEEIRPGLLVGATLEVEPDGLLVVYPESQNEVIPSRVRAQRVRVETDGVRLCSS